MTGFTRHRRSGAAVTTFTAFEADLLRSLAGQLIELLRNESATIETDADADSLEDLLDFSGPTLEPEDPVLARLFPTAYPEDEEAAAEFRRFTEDTLAGNKIRNALAVAGSLDGADPSAGSLEVTLDAPAVQAWLRCLTDIRLTVAARLGIEVDGDEGADDDESLMLREVYDWLGFVQGSLIEALES